MRIIIICSHFPPTESPESAHAMFLCEKLAEHGHEIDLITNQLLVGAPPARGFSIHPVMKNWGWGELHILLKTIFRIRPDSILLMYIDWIYGCSPMVTFLPSIVKLFSPATKFVAQFENISGLTGLKPPSSLRSRFYLKLAKVFFQSSSPSNIYGTLLGASDEIIALSDRHADVFVLKEPSSKNKTKVIPAPPIMRFANNNPKKSAREEGRKILNLNSKQIIISYFGYLYNMKGVETLVYAIQYLPQDVKILFIGGTSDQSYMEKLKDIAHSTGVVSQVLWLGHCKPEESLASSYLYASDICVLPFNDGVRLNNSSFAVAASHGLPIVTTRGDKLESPFMDNENVKLCLPQSPELLGAAINELITDPELRQKLAVGSKKLADTYFSWDRVINSTLECLFSENK